MNWTLRDLRRLRAKSPRLVWIERGYLKVRADGHALNFADVWPVSPDQARKGEPVEATLDRLIGQLGPKYELPEDWIPFGQERPKGTDEVAEQGSDPSEDSTMHGGDGNSGEVEAEADTTSTQADQDAAQGEPAGESSGGGAGGPGESQESSPCAPPAGGQLGEATGAEGEDRTPATPGEEDHSRTDDTPGAESSSAARSVGEPSNPILGANGDPEDSAVNLGGEDRPADLAEPTEFSESGGAGSHSATPRDVYGGQNASLREARSGLRTAEEKRSARRLSRRLDRLFAGWSVGGLDESPRLDSRRLVKHLVSKRGQLSRCIRRETDQRHELIILAADVSGSCSAVAQDTVAAIARVAEHDDRVVLVSHSNGLPLEIQGGPAGHRIAPATDMAEADFDAGTERHGGTIRWWRELIRRHRIVGTVTLGDHGAEWIYRELAALAPLVWLDSFCKASGVKKRQSHIPKYWPAKARKNTAYISGVGDAQSADEALALLEK